MKDYTLSEIKQICQMQSDCYECPAEDPSWSGGCLLHNAPCDWPIAEDGMTQSEKIEALKTYCLRHCCMECILNSPIVLDEHDGDCIVSCWEDGLLLDMADELLVDYLYTRMVSDERLYAE